MVPFDVYKGETRDCNTFNHDILYEELNQYIKGVKQNNLWDEKQVISGLKILLDKHLGAPPLKFI